MSSGRLRPADPKTAERLRELRISAKKSQQVVADFCEVHQTAIGQYERGHCQPGAGVLRRLADYYGVSADYLLGRAEEKKFPL